MDADNPLAKVPETMARNASGTISARRSGIRALMPAIKIPTLTLNQVDPQLLPRGPLYTLSLSLEDEARQVAKLIASQNFSRVGLVTGSSPLSKRIRAAFEQEWINMAGIISAKVQLSHNQSDYGKIRSALQTADAIFIAAEPPLVRQVMPFVARIAPIYGTSQIYDGKNGTGANVDLQDIRFVDMPWMVDPTHAAVAVYPRSPKAASAELDRLYALGIDAYRLALMMAAQGTLGPWLDGVTGEITARTQQLQRDLLPATIDNDQAVPFKLPKS